MTTQGIIIFVLSVLWLVIVGSFYAVRVVIVPVEESQVWKRVVIGVLYTFIGGIGMSYGIMSGFIAHHPAPLPWDSIVIILGTPWLSFCITGPIMIGMQVEKHRILDWARRAGEDAFLARRRMDDGQDPLSD